MSEIDLDAIEAEFLNQCPSCDFGLPAGCACSDKDHRPVMSDLIARVRELEAVVERVRELAARYDAWDGSKDYEWSSSPRDRERLHAAIEGDRP